ncbi:Glutamate--cysteine ligase [Tsukamurella paurometabola]
MSTFAELEAVVALIHCLVVWLDGRLDAGERLPTLPPWHVQENKWRAARYGLDAIIIQDADNNERLVTEDLDDLLEQLTPIARGFRVASGNCERYRISRDARPPISGSAPWPAGSATWTPTAMWCAR